jgi:hypothetical protein
MKNEDRREEEQISIVHRREDALQCKVPEYRSSSKRSDRYSTNNAYERFLPNGQNIGCQMPHPFCELFDGPGIFSTGAMKQPFRSRRSGTVLVLV